MATATRRRKAPGSKSKAFAEKRRAEVTGLRDRLAEFTADEGNAGLIAAALATLDGYSDRNATLIAMQCPTAIDVSGYRQWQARGRQVMRGETGIRILAPAGSREVPVDQAEPDGDTETRQFFRPVSVFDIAQTMTLAEVEAVEAARLAAQDEQADDFDLVA
jgi:hypothetical protein